MDAQKQGADALFILLGAVMVLAMHATTQASSTTVPWPAWSQSAQALTSCTPWAP